MRVPYLKKSPNYCIWPIPSRNGSAILTRKRHAQKERECRSPRSKTTTQQIAALPDHPLFFIVHYTVPLNIILNTYM